MKGRSARNPPRPMMLRSPNAHEGHAGTIRLIKMLEDPSAIEFEICLCIRRTLMEITIPESIDKIINEISEIVEIAVKVPAIKDKSSPKENLESSTL